jgi:HEAT repeat protein
MRHALLERGVGTDLRSRQLADLLLSTWGGWTKDDVPELAKVLASNHGGMIAHALGDIGTPEAIEVLANDIRFADMGQSDYVLSKIGPRAVPYLFPLLEDSESARAAAGVITRIGVAASPFAETWSKLAADPDQQIKVRIGALRGIAALGKVARGSTGRLHPLLTAPEEKLRLAAVDALLSAVDPAAIQTIAGECRPHAAPMDYYGWLHSTVCLQDIWRFGTDAAVVGPLLLPFLKSNSADERLMGAITFGVIGYRPASVPLQMALHDADWRWSTQRPETLDGCGQWMLLRSSRYCEYSLATGSPTNGNCIARCVVFAAPRLGHLRWSRTNARFLIMGAPEAILLISTSLMIWLRVPKRNGSGSQLISACRTDASSGSPIR